MSYNVYIFINKTNDINNLNIFILASEESVGVSNHHRNNSSTDETQKNEKFMNVNTNINTNKTNTSNIEERHEINDQVRANKENTDASSTTSQNCDHLSKNNYQRHNSNYGTQRIPAKYGRKVTNDRKIGRYDNNYRERKNNYQEYNNYKERYEEGKVDITKDKYKNKDVIQETKEVEIVNWRQKGEGNDRNGISKRKQNKKHEGNDKFFLL